MSLFYVSASDIDQSEPGRVGVSEPGRVGVSEPGRVGPVEARKKFNKDCFPGRHAPALRIAQTRPGRHAPGSERDQGGTPRL